MPDMQNFSYLHNIDAVVRVDDLITVNSGDIMRVMEIDSDGTATIYPESLRISNLKKLKRKQNKIKQELPYYRAFEKRFH